VRLEERLGEELKAREMTLAVAESCTGGLLASRITDVPGSSAYFRGGIVAYTNTVKETILGVSKDVISVHGAVSSKCAREMALGALRVFGADLALATTGIAGPDGGTEEKPVGLVHIALAARDGTLMLRRLRFDGARKENKWSATEAAFQLLLEYSNNNIWNVFQNH